MSLGAGGKRIARVEHETDPYFVTRTRPPKPAEPTYEIAEDGVPRGVQTAIRNQGAPAGALGSSAVLSLQRQAGNAAVSTLVQRSLATDEELEDDSPVLDVVGQGGGEPLPAELLDEMEGRMGEDFSDVRLHTGEEAEHSAASVAAKAYTSGNEIVMGPGSAPLETDEGKRTIAHELTHVVQQRNGAVDATPAGGGIALSDPSDRFEQAAEANAEQVMSGEGAQVAEESAAGPAGVMRQVDEDIDDETITEEAIEGESEEDIGGETEEDIEGGLPDETVSDLSPEEEEMEGEEEASGGEEDLLEEGEEEPEEETEED